MNKMWWKVLGVIILIYVIIFGMTTPLKPGVTNIDGYLINAGEKATIEITGYNTNYKEAKNHVWLKLNNDNLLKGEATPLSNNVLSASFDIPESFPVKGENHDLTLLTYNPIDGPSVTPAAVTVRGAKDTTATWSTVDLSMITDKQGIQFPYRSTLHETVRNTFFHIPLWFSMFILLMVGLWYSIRYLRFKEADDDTIASAVTTVAILFGLLGIITGSIWAKFTWGAWWTADVKLNMSTTAMLIYCAYIVLRSSVTDRDRRAQLSAAYSIFAFVALIPLIFIIPRMTESMHPGNGGNPALGGEDMENTLRMVFYPAVIGFTLLGLWIASLSIRYQRLVEEKYV